MDVCRPKDMCGRRGGFTCESSFSHRQRRQGEAYKGEYSPHTVANTITNRNKLGRNVIECNYEVLKHVDLAAQPNEQMLPDMRSAVCRVRIKGKESWSVCHRSIPMRKESRDDQLVGVAQRMELSPAQVIILVKFRSGGFSGGYSNTRRE